MKLLKPIKSLRQRHYLVICLIALLLPNIALCLSPYLSVVAKVLNVLMPMGLWLMILSLGKRPGKVLLYALPLMLLINCVQLVLLTIFEGGVIAVDLLLSLFSASGDEAGELLGGLILPIVLVLVLHIIIVALGIRSIKLREELPKKQRIKTIGIGLGLVLLGLPLALWAQHINPSHTLRGDVYPLNVFYNTYVAGEKLSLLAHLDESTAAHDYQAFAEHQDEGREVYVFFLGETSRAFSYQLYGYPRQTNPRLAQRDTTSLLVYRDLVTQSNTTSKSAPILLSPADAEHSQRLGEVKGLLSAMKQAGYYTVFISNQPANRSFLDYFAYEADEHIRIRDIIRTKRPLRDKMKPIHDGEILPFLDQVLRKQHQKLFVVLHGYGAHWSYIDRYPKEFAHFRPDEALGANPRQKEQLTNAYDNAIRYTDYVIDEVISRLERDTLATTALYYTADHGEDVYDDARERILHSSPSISYYQVHIPGILWLSDNYLRKYPSKSQSARLNQGKAATSRSNLHTLLELAGVGSPERQDTLSLLSPYYREGLRTYLNDRYECVPLYEMLQAPEDIEMWQRMRLKPLRPE